MRTWCVAMWLVACGGVVSGAEPEPRQAEEFRILDGRPTRIHFTGNPHHPTFGIDALKRLLDRHFEGRSPVRVDGLDDARRDPVTRQPIPPAKVPELIRFLEPVFAAPRPKDERLVVLCYAIVEEPRTKKSPQWIAEGADALEQYGRAALRGGAQRVFAAEMVQPDHIGGGPSGNRFRRAGLHVFDALERRAVPGIVRGPHLQERMEKRKHFFRDDRHYSDAGREYIALLWYEAILKHDGLRVPAWCREEIRTLEESGGK